MEKEYVSREWLAERVPEYAAQILRGDIKVMQSDTERIIRLPNTTIFTLKIGQLEQIFNECFRAYHFFDFIVRNYGFVGIEYAMKLYPDKK